MIYEFYETLAKEVERLAIPHKPEAFYNCDKSGFPVDPSECKFIDPIGKKTSQVNHGSKRENLSILGVCSADDKTLDLLFVFKGKFPQTTWLCSKFLKTPNLL